MAPTPKQAMMVTIARWEGLWQAMPGDPGNYLDGRLIGTMRGVTPAVLAAHLGVAHDAITPAFMREKVTLELAGEIAEARFYRGTISPLAWCAAADVVTDFGWGSGPGQAIKSTERALGVETPDFRFDSHSVGLWAAMLERDGVEKMVWWVHDWRQAFYDLICRVNPTLQQFRQGWWNRARWQTPESREWWQHWAGEDTAAICAACEPMPSAPMPVALLSQGMVGVDVKRLQQRLIAEGHLVGDAADGFFGPKTDAAVRRFQEARGLVVDGWVGNATRAALGMAA